MTRPPWPAVKALFDAVAELDTPAREQALAGSDAAPAVREEVRSLLAQHDAQRREGEAFLGAAAALPQERERRGERLGPWMVGERLGSGGMGEVYAARRADGAYDARVAVKVLREGLLSDALLARFEQEQRQLARLNHPHIARLLDAGRTGDGRPYFVMEAVDGRPIDAACHGADLAARVRLFLQLAQAVAHAHAQGLIHRDLKPANVLVTPQGEVKLLDFGIAQVLERHGDAEHGARPLTPGYASPEQVRGEPVTEASDVYALGVLLHVMLTGARPYGRASTTAQAALRAVLSEPPTPPSRMPVVSSADAGVPRRQLRGDLDAIVAQALAKPVTQRYATVQALSDDLTAWSQRRPVAARGGGWAYRGWRMLQRHALSAAALVLAAAAALATLGAAAWGAHDALSALALMALAGGTGLAVWQARRASAARDAAQRSLEQMRGLVRDIVQRHADTVTFLPGGLQSKADLLTDTLAWLERAAAGATDDAALAGERAKAHARLSDLYVPGIDATLDDAPRAGHHAERALALFPTGEAAHHRDSAYWRWWARALRTRTALLRTAGDAPAALASESRRADLLRGAVQRFPGDMALRFELGSSLLGLGQIHDSLKLIGHLAEPERALAAFAEAHAHFEHLLHEHPDDGDMHYQLGTVAGAQMITLGNLGRSAEAAAQGRRAVAWRESALALDGHNTAYRSGLAGEINNLVNVLLDLPGTDDEALRLSARGEAVIRELIADDPQTATWGQRSRWFALQRGRALLRAGLAAEALPRLEDALSAMAHAQGTAALRRRVVGLVALAQALQAVHRNEEARAHALAAVSDLEPLRSAQAFDRGLVQLHAEATRLAAVPP
jgi:hypothetical protein